MLVIALRRGEQSREPGDWAGRFGVLHKRNSLVLQAQPDNLAEAESTIATNLLGPIRLTAALLPVLQKQPRSAIMNVSSGLAFVPMAPTPTYCATKAAIHSYTQSLRHQIRASTIEVLELIPPYVATDLMDGPPTPTLCRWTSSSPR